MKTQTNRIVLQCRVIRAFRAFGLSLGVAGLMVANSYGIGVFLPNQDAEAIGRGNAFAATADNPSAIFYNPAGITQIQGQEAEVGVINYLGIDVNYKAPNGATTDNNFEVTPAPQLYYTFSPTNLPLSFGLGFYAPFGLASSGRTFSTSVRLPWNHGCNTSP